MSRKWERMVEKNMKTVNKRRKKQGEPSIYDARQAGLFKGRSVLFSLTALAIVVIMLLFFNGPKDALYWFTLVSYLFLAWFLYFIKRPFLRIGKKQLSTRKWNREIFVDADQIERIVLLPGYVVIQLKNQGKRWVFSRVMNLYPVARMAADLREFSRQYGVALHDEM